MDDSEQVRCCGRSMTRIAVEHAEVGVELHSCASCGQHAWRRDGQPVDREQLLEALQVRRPVPGRAPGRRRPAATGPDGEDRRADLQRMLTGFRVHGPAT